MKVKPDDQPYDPEVKCLLDVGALMKYCNDPTASDDLKLSILEWLWDKRSMIEKIETQDEQFQKDVEIFKQLIDSRE